MYVIYEEDIIISKTLTKNYENCIELPNEFTDYDLDRLRFDGENIIDVDSYTKFYIDEFGDKHIQQDENNTRQILECKWYDELEQDKNGQWKVVTLDKKKEEKMYKVYELRKQKESEGIFVDDFFVDTSETGRLNLSNTINAYEWGLIDKSETVSWKVRTGEFKEVNYDKLKIFAGYVAYYIEQLFGVEKYHTDNIKALETIEDIESYDINIGWPPTQYSTNTNEE